MKLTEQQMNELVDRFLGWKLPLNFHPSGGIAFSHLQPLFNWPAGTNLLTANQARNMLEYVLAPLQDERPRLAESWNRRAPIISKPDNGGANNV